MIGIGVNIRPFLNKVARAAADYYNRITADGGVSESPDCVNSGMSDLDRQNLLNNASLLLIPSGYKGGKLYSEIPTNGNGDLTWTRGGDAFRTNASGVIQRVPWNLLTNSNDLASQQLQALGKYTVSSNVAISPDGTQTADKFIITGTDSYQGVVKTPIPNGTYTISMFAKASGKNWVFFYEIGSPSGTNGVWFNISTGQIGSIGSAWSNVTITNVGNDWYRCSATTTLSATNYLYWLVADSNSNPTVTANGTDGVLMWGLQFVEGTTAQTYLPTTDRLNFPRLSYMYGSCPSALLEPQRTNLLLQSQDFDNVYWAKQSGATVTANTTTSPDGTTNADTINLVSGSIISRVEKAGISYSAATAYTLSFYFKNIALTSGQTFAIRIEGSGGFDLVGTIDLFNNTNSVALSGTAGSGFVSSSQRATYDILANGWVRCSIGLTTGTNVGNATVYIISNVNANRSFYAYGAQLEAGAYPTTYIPTTSATATRVADSAVKTGISSLIGQSSGTLFVSAIPNLDTFFIPNVIIRTSFSDVIAVGFIDNKVSLRIRISNSGFLTLYTSTTVYTTGSIVKIALKYTSTSYNLFINGTSVSSLSTSMPSSFDTISLNGDGPFFSIGRVFNQQIALYTTALSDTDCELLTGTAYSSYESMATALGYYVI